MVGKGQAVFSMVVKGLICLLWLQGKGLGYLVKSVCYGVRLFAMLVKS